MIYVLAYFSVMLNEIAAIYLFGKLSSKKIKINKYDIVIMNLYGIIQLYLNLSGQKMTGTLITILYFFILFKKLYKCSYTESKNYSVIIWTTSIILDITIMLIMNLLNVSNNQGDYTLLFQIVSSIAMSLIIFSIARYNHYKKIANKLYTKIVTLKINPFIILIIILIFLIIELINYTNMSNRINIIITILSSLMICYIIVKLLSLKYQVITLKKTNHILEKNDEVNKKIIGEYRIMKHNLESKLIGVKSVSNQEARVLIDEIIRDYNNSFYIKHDINSMPIGINGLITEKLYKYRKNNINLTIHNTISDSILKIIGPKKYNLLCESLGVVLDNALENAKKSHDKIVCFSFKEKKDFIEIMIQNSFLGSLDLEQFGSINYTTNKNGHGLGIYSLIIKKNIEIKTNIRGTIFTNIIKIKK